jgi:hypothetical protein
VWLSCSQRCGGALFRALFAEVDLDARGDYQGHQIAQQGYVCLNCGSPALDLGEVPQVMDEDAEDDVAPIPVDVLCPHCETLVSVPAGADCPNCGAELELPQLG